MIDSRKLTVLATVLIIAETVALFILAFSTYDEKYVLALIVLMILTSLLFFVPMFPLTSTFDSDSSSFLIRGPYLGKRIQHSEVVAVEYRSFDIGGKLFGIYMGRGRLGGTFRNSEFGTYEITGFHRGTGTKFILLELSGEKIVAFNLKTEEETINVYEHIKQNIVSRGAVHTRDFRSIPRDVENIHGHDAGDNNSRRIIPLSLSFGILAPLISATLYKGGTAMTILIPTLIAASIPIIAIIVHIRHSNKTGLPKEDRRKTTTILGLQLSIIPILFAVAGLLIVPATIDIDLSEDHFSVNAIMLDEKIYYDDIYSLEITEEKFKRVWGYGGSEIGTGNFSNSNLGKVKYAAYSDVSVKIVVEHKGGIFVFNQSTEEATLDMLESLRLKTGL